MIEILVHAQTQSNIVGGQYGLGFPVVAMKEGWGWGGEERPPKFVVVKITDTDDVTQWCDPWHRKTIYEILAHDAAQDFFRVKINPDLASPACAITVEEMQQFLLGWGAKQIQQADALSVVFEITAINAIRSKGLFTFDSEDDYTQYEELSYDAVTGTHTVRIDYSLTGMSQMQMQRALGRSTLTIIAIDHDKSECIVVGDRAKMIGVLERQVADRFNKMIARCRWRFGDAVVATALARGGVVEMTNAEAEADMVDIATEV